MKTLPSLRPLSARVTNMVPSPIKEMMMLASRLKEPLSLAHGIPAEDTPEHIKRAMIEAIEGPVASKYSVFPGTKECRQAVATRYQRMYGVDFDSDKNIAITVGGLEACMDTLLAMVDPGDEVVMISPCFSSHIEEVLACLGKPVFVRTNEKEGWQLDIKAVKKAITKKTKLILVTNPSNPTGAVYPEKQVREIASLASEYGLFVLADETYDFLTYDKTPFFSFSQIPEIRKNLILIGSSSKEYCMTGYRLGWVIADSAILEEILKLHDANTACANVATQFGYVAAIQGSQNCVAELKKNMEERRNLMCERLDRLPHLFQYDKKPEGAYYILPRIVFPNKGSLDAALQIQKATQVITIPGIAFGPDGEGHIRFSFGGGSARAPMGKELINEAFDRIEKWGKRYE